MNSITGENVADKVKEYIFTYCMPTHRIKNLGYRQISDVEEDRPLDVLCVDSLDRVEMTMYLEEEFDIVITDAEMEHWFRVKHVIDGVHQVITINKR